MINLGLWTQSTTLQLLYHYRLTLKEKTFEIICCDSISNRNISTSQSDSHPNKLWIFTYRISSFLEPPQCIYTDLHVSERIRTPSISSSVKISTSPPVEISTSMIKIGAIKWTRFASPHSLFFPKQRVEISPAEPLAVG